MVKEIPGEMIEDILVKLPVKSLIRFRCVSKAWCCLITSPRFARRQLNQHLHLTNSNHRCYRNSLILHSDVVYIVDNEGEELASKISFFWNLEHVFPKRLPSPFKIDTRKNYFKVSGCCHGILCLVFENDGGIVLWNPRIGNDQYKKITVPDNYLGTCEVVGFGYDSTIDDYKVVRGPCRPHPHPRDSFENSFIVQVLTLKSNTWKTVHDYVPFLIDPDCSATTFNGGVYWFASCLGKRTALVCFDLAEENLREVALPPIRGMIPWLGLAGDCLCILAQTESKTHFDLWVLKGDSSWAKLFTIPRLTGPSFHGYFMPLCFAKNGAFLLNVGDNKFLMYNSKDNTFTKFWACGIQSWSQVIVFADSLVSPCTSSSSSI